MWYSCQVLAQGIPMMFMGTEWHHSGWWGVEDHHCLNWDYQSMYWILLYCIVLYCTVLYSSVLCDTVLYKVLGTCVYSTIHDTTQQKYCSMFPSWTSSCDRRKKCLFPLPVLPLPDDEIGQHMSALVRAANRLRTDSHCSPRTAPSSPPTTTRAAASSASCARYVHSAVLYRTARYRTVRYFTVRLRLPATWEKIAAIVGCSQWCTQWS